MGIRREMEKGFTVLANEFKAYRSIVEEGRACYDSAWTNVHGPVRGAIRIIGRLGSEIYGAIQYPIERRTEGNTPEKILRHNKKKIAGWREFGKSPTHTS